MEKLFFVVIYVVIMVFLNLKKKKPQSSQDIDFANFGKANANRTNSGTRQVRRSSMEPISFGNEPVEDDFVQAMLNLGGLGKGDKRSGTPARKANKAAARESMASQRSNQTASAKVNVKAPKMPEMASKQSSQGVSFEREDILKAFVMKELMQRYDLNRIYERIPAAKFDE
jgi:hypothetical protein